MTNWPHRVWISLYIFIKKKLFATPFVVSSIIWRIESVKPSKCPWFNAVVFDSCCAVRVRLNYKSISQFIHFQFDTLRYDDSARIGCWWVCVYINHGRSYIRTGTRTATATGTGTRTKQQKKNKQTKFKSKCSITLNRNYREKKTDRPDWGQTLMLFKTNYEMKTKQPNQPSIQPEKESNLLKSFGSEWKHKKNADMQP